MVGGRGAVISGSPETHQRVTAVGVGLVADGGRGGEGVLNTWASR